MPWTAKFENAGFIEPVVANMITAIEANQTQALAMANGEASTFASKFGAEFIEPVVANMLASITTNMTAALLWANGPDPLPILNDAEAPILNDADDPIYTF